VVTIINKNQIKNGKFRNQTRRNCKNNLKSMETIMQNDFELLELEHKKNVLKYQNKILNAAILNLQKHLKID